MQGAVSRVVKEKKGLVILGVGVGVG